jgi:hypothetical protein
VVDQSPAQLILLLTLEFAQSGSVVARKSRSLAAHPLPQRLVVCPSYGEIAFHRIKSTSHFPR